jgi:hypothetical protein
VDDLIQLKPPCLTEEFNLTFLDHLMQSLSIVRKLCDRLAIVPRLPGPVVNGECKMVGGYRAGNGGTQGLDSFHCCTSRSMLENYTEPWEVGMEFP